MRASAFVCAALVALVLVTCSAAQKQSDAKYVHYHGKKVHIPQRPSYTNDVQISATVNWANVVYKVVTETALQVVGNPLLRRGMPTHDAMWKSLADLEADYVRYVPWFPYPALGVAELDPPNSRAHTTSWDFTECGNMLDDLMDAVGNHSVIINFSTQPTWLYNTDSWDYPSNPNAVDWGYPRGNGLRDPTGQALGDYYGRLLAWMTEGGFTDEYGRQVTGGRKYRFAYWEVFNEPEGCHGIDASDYVQQYNFVVQGFKKFAPNGAADMAYCGPALGGHNEFDWYAAVLNASNFAVDVPAPDLITFHYYAGADSRLDPSSYEAFFPGVDSFAEECDKVIALRNQLRPSARLDVDELGVILPNDNDANAPTPPAVYWNAAGAMYAYSYMTLGAKGIDVLGQSQLVGNPAMPELKLDPQYPSVALLNWTTGAGNARYWVLKMLLEHFRPGMGVAAQTQVISNPMCGSIINLANLTLQCADPSAVITAIQFASYGTPTGQCGSYALGTCNAANSSEIVSKYCLGQNQCTVPADTPTFGDPCYGTVKYLVVQAQCSTGGGLSTTAVAVQAYRTVSGERKLLVVNKSHLAQQVVFAEADGAQMWTVDEQTGDGPARQDVQTGTTIVLAPFAVSVLQLK